MAQAGLILLLLPAVSSAEIVFTNFGPSQTYNTAVGNTAGNDFVGDNLAEGDTFTPAVSASFGSISIALSCELSSCPAPFTVDLTADSGLDSPGSVLESFTGSGLVLGPLGVYNPPIVLTASGAPITLAAGTQYWVTLSTGLSNSIAWNLNSTGDTSDQAISTDGGATYFSPSGLTPGAYEIDSPTTTVAPEPNMALLLVMGLAVAGTAASRRRHRPVCE
jgi:hypothetical protein